MQVASSGIKARRSSRTSSIPRACESVLLVMPVARDIASEICIDGALQSKSGVGRVNSLKNDIVPSGCDTPAPTAIIVSE